VNEARQRVLIALISNPRTVGAETTVVAGGRRHCLHALR
jgi:hypothetical protein